MCFSKYSNLGTEPLASSTRSPRMWGRLLGAASTTGASRKGSDYLNRSSCSEWSCWLERLRSRYLCASGWAFSSSRSWTKSSCRLFLVEASVNLYGLVLNSYLLQMCHLIL